MCAGYTKTPSCEPRCTMIEVSFSFLTLEYYSYQKCATQPLILEPPSSGQKHPANLELSTSSMVTACIVLLYISYTIPVVCLLIRGRNNIPHGPFWMGRVGLFSNIVLLAWTAFTLIMYSFPPVQPVTAGSEFYHSLLILFLILLIRSFSYSLLAPTFLNYFFPISCFIIHSLIFVPLAPIPFSLFRFYHVPLPVPPFPSLILHLPRFPFTHNHPLPLES